MCIYVLDPPGQPTPVLLLLQPLPAGEHGMALPYGSNMRYMDVPTLLALSQLPQLHHIADAFPLPIHLSVFEAIQAGEKGQAPAAHTA